MSYIAQASFEKTTLSRTLIWFGQNALNLWYLSQEKLMLKRAEAKLHALDDRLLNDIGLDRSSIKTAVREGNRAITNRMS